MGVDEGQAEEADVVVKLLADDVVPADVADVVERVQEGTAGWAGKGRGRMTSGLRKQGRPQRLRQRGRAQVHGVPGSSMPYGLALSLRDWRRFWANDVGFEKTVLRLRD